MHSPIAGDIVLLSRFIEPARSLPDAHAWTDRCRSQRMAFFALCGVPQTDLTRLTAGTWESPAPYPIEVTPPSGKDWHNPPGRFERATGYTQ